MEEIWKDVEGYDGIYQVSNHGRVRTYNGDTRWTKGKLSEPKILKPIVQGIDYLCVIIAKNSKARSLKIHRLVAFAFIPNPINLEYINHIDSNRKNNHVSNLEWVSKRENNTHRYVGKERASSYFGVTRYNDKRSPNCIKKWKARIIFGKKEKFLGLFENEIDAHYAVQGYMKEHGIVNKYAPL